MADSTKKQTFAVEGMHCASCSMAIDWELEDLHGVTEAKTSYPKGITEVSFDPTVVGADEIIDAISRAGFEARLY